MLKKILGKIKQEKLLLFSWVILILSILTAYSNYNEIKDGAQMMSLFTSDTLGLPSLYKDLFADNGHFKNWTFAAAPTLFPDIFLYFSLAFFLGLNFITVALVYGLIQVCSITFLCIYIYKKLVPEPYVVYKWLIPLFISFSFMESFYFTNDLFFGFMLLSYSFHMGSFLNSLIFISVFVSPAKKIVKYVFFLLFTILAVFSDKLFIVMLVIPLLLTIAITIIKTKEYKFFLITTILMGLGCVSALKFYEYINLNKFATFVSPHNMYAFDNIIPSIKTFFGQLLNYCAAPGFRSFMIIFTFFGFFFVLFRSIRNFNTASKTTLILSFFYIFFFICVLFAPLLNGNYTGWDTLRYNITPFFLSSIGFALFFAVIFKNRSEKISRSFSLVVLILFFFIASIKFNKTGFANYIHFYPKKVAEIDSVANKYDLKRGISEYWTAKKTSMFSKENVKIVSVYENASIQELGTNINWFFDKEFDFIVANGILPSEIVKQFNIKDTIRTPHYEILIVEPFIYSKSYLPQKLSR